MQGTIEVVGIGGSSIPDFTAERAVRPAPGTGAGPIAGPERGTRSGRRASGRRTRAHRPPHTADDTAATGSTATGSTAARVGARGYVRTRSTPTAAPVVAPGPHG